MHQKTKTNLATEAGEVKSNTEQTTPSRPGVPNRTWPNTLQTSDDPTFKPLFRHRHSCFFPIIFRVPHTLPTPRPQPSPSRQPPPGQTSS